MSKYTHSRVDVNLPESAVIDDAYLYQPTGSDVQDVAVSFKSVIGDSRIERVFVNSKITMTRAQAEALQATLNILLMAEAPEAGKVEHVFVSGDLADKYDTLV